MTFRGIAAPVFLVLSALLLTGCEAPLSLDGVYRQRAATLQRSDLLQAVADNGATIVVTGNRGVVLTSHDRAASWERLMLAGGPFLLDVASCPDGSFVALAARNQVWVADASASAWSMQPIDSADTPQALTCDPRGRIWVVGGFSSILVSDDAGASWSATSLDEDLHFTSVQFVDERHAVLTGEFGTIVRSGDGGATWQSLPNLANEFYPQDAWFRDTENGWIVGLNGTLLSTTDGGLTWLREPTGTSTPLYGIVQGAKGLYAVGGFGTVLRSPDGRDWRRIDHGQPIRFYLRGALALDGRGLLVAGGAGALHLVEG